MPVNGDPVRVGVAVDDFGAAVLVVGREVVGRHRVQSARGIPEPQRAQQDQHRCDEQIEAGAHGRARRQAEGDDRGDDGVARVSRTS